MYPFEGMMVPTFTPFHQDGSLHLEILPEYADHLVKLGIKGIFVNGTSGEGYSMTLEERKIVTAAWAKEAKSKNFNMIVMISAACLKDTIELALHAKDVKASGIALLPPLYDKPASIEDLADYCKEVADAVPELPVFYYHIPFKTGVNLPMDDFLEICSKSIENLRGMKFTSTDVAGEGLRCLHLRGGKFTIFAGLDQTLSESLSLGYKCAINVSSNFMAREALKIFDLASQIKDPDELKSAAKKHQRIIDDTLSLIFSFSDGAFNISAAKGAMKALTGIDVGPARKPCKLVPKEAIERMEKALNLFMEQNSINGQ